MSARLTTPSPLELSKALGLAYRCASLRSRESSDILTSVYGDRLRVSYDPHAHRLTALCASTHTLDQWLSNLRRKKETARAFMPRVPGQIHSDFALRVGELYPYLKNAWESHDWPTIDFAGHSRGGALTTVLAALIAANETPRAVGDVITYGCPRLGDSRFANWYAETLGSKSMRLVYCADGVPYLPSILRGYSNMCSLVYIDRHGGISMDYKSPPLLDRAIAMARHIGTRGVRLVEDHNLSNYISALEKSLATQP